MERQITFAPFCRGSNEKHIKGGWEQAAQLLADHIFKAEAADYDPAV